MTQENKEEKSAFDSYLEKLEQQSSETTEKNKEVPKEEAENKNKSERPDNLTDEELDSISKSREEKSEGDEEGKEKTSEELEDDASIESESLEEEQPVKDDLDDEEMVRDIDGRTRFSKGKIVGDDLLNETDKSEDDFEANDLTAQLESDNEQKEKDKAEQEALKKMHDKNRADWNRVQRANEAYRANADAYNREAQAQAQAQENKPQPFIEKKKSNETDDFYDQYIERVRTDSDNRHVDTGKVTLSRDKDSDLTDNPLSNVSANTIAKESSNQATTVVQGAAPSMGNESSQKDESTRNSQAKQVGKSTIKMMTEGAEREIDGVHVQLVSNIADSGVASDLAKETDLNTALSYATTVSDRRSAEENLQKATQMGINVATKKEGNFNNSVDKILERNENPALRRAESSSNEVEVDGLTYSVDKSRKLSDADNTQYQNARNLNKNSLRTNGNRQYNQNTASQNNSSNNGIVENQKNATENSKVFSGRTSDLEAKGIASTEKTNGKSAIGTERRGLKLNRNSGDDFKKSSSMKFKGSVEGAKQNVGRVKLSHGTDINSIDSLSNAKDSIKGGLSEHAGAIASIAGQLMKSTSDTDDQEMNPSSIAKSGKKLYDDVLKSDKKGRLSKTSKGGNSDIYAKGVTNGKTNPKGVKSKVNAKSGKESKATVDKMAKGNPYARNTEKSAVHKSDGTLRMVKNGQDSGLNNIKGDSPGIKKVEANKKLLENHKKTQSKAKIKKSATEEYKESMKTKDGGIRLSHGQEEKITKGSEPKATLEDKINSKGGSVNSKITHGNVSKTGNLNIGRGARISTKSGPLSSSADAARKGGEVVRNFLSKSGGATAHATTQAAQAKVIAKAVAKKAIAVTAATTMSAGAVAGGSAAINSMGSNEDLFGVVAAAEYDDENDTSALTQDAVDMMYARLKAYQNLASGKKLSESELKKAGSEYAELANIGVGETYNGAKVKSGKTKFKFIDRDDKTIDKEHFLLDDRSDLVFPTDGIGGSGGLGGSGEALGPVDSGHPVNVPYTITQGLHQFAAIDLACPEGTPIYAVSDGEVLDTNTTAMDINGNYLIHTLPNGEMIYYGHMNQPPLVKIGDHIKKGQHIGYVGQTGLATGPHIHFDIRSGGLWSPGSNPWKLLPGVPSGAVGITVDPATSKGETPDTQSPSSSTPTPTTDKKSDNKKKDDDKSGGSGGNESGGKAKKDENGQTQMDIMLNMIGACETGGQVYGQRDYANFINAELGAEVTATLGWSSFYGVHGREWLRKFKEQNPDLFKELDKGGQVDPVLNIEWEATGWQANPTQKASIVDMLTTDQGKKLQDSMTAERLAVHWKKCVSTYTDNMRAVAWYTQIAELAGSGVADAFFSDLGGNYSSDHIYNYLITAYNRGGSTIGAPMYHRRHQLYKEWIDHYYKEDEICDVNNIEVTGAGAIFTGGNNPNSSGDSRAGQMLLIREILSLSAMGSYYADPARKKDYMKYCAEMLDVAIKGKDGKGIKTTATQNQDGTVNVDTEFKVLCDLYLLEKMDKNFKSWDLWSEKYGDKTVQAYMALRTDDFEKIFNVKLKPGALGSKSNGGKGLPYVKWALDIADNAEHGYSQRRRDGNPDYDCSSLVWYALNQAGFDVGSSAFATPTMPSVLQSAGFTMHEFKSVDELQPGDIMLNPGHTEIYTGDGKTVGAHADEQGGIEGVQGGDQNMPASLGGYGEISEIPINVGAWTGNHYFRPPKEYVDANSGSESGSKGDVQFGPDGLLKEQASEAGQKVINQLLAIPGHMNGGNLHKEWGIDDNIDKLSTEEAIWVLHRIEGAGFGQTGAGYAGADTPESHKALVDQQINGRFNGSIHELLKHWGTYSYGGY